MEGDRPRAAAVVLVTAPDVETGRKIARELVLRRLAACVNLVPGLTSVYRWQGAVEEASEVLLVIKTVRARVAELERDVRALHPYELAEFVVLDPAHTGARYLDWLIAETAPGGP
jgi:periplasmic divalent cation tolerance protein